MKRVRRQRLRSALILVVMAALLWSQTVLAHHALCTVSPSLPVVAHDEAADCHRTSPSVESVICDTHCGQGDLSHDATRELSVPMLGPVAFVPATLIALLPQALTPRDPAPPRSWHRPTPHPASLLLI